MQSMHALRNASERATQRHQIESSVDYPNGRRRRRVRAILLLVAASISRQ
jgi:hypothetical protein